MKKLLCFVAAIGCLASVASAQFLTQETAQIFETTTPPTIDGVRDAGLWDVPAIQVDHLIYDDRTDTSITPPPESDISGTVRGLWDSSNLYMLVEVTDDLVKAEPGSQWLDDNVELFFDFDLSGGDEGDLTSDTDNYDGSDDRQIRFNPFYTDPYSGKNQDTLTVDLDIFYEIVVPASNTEGYVVEFSVDWNALSNFASPSMAIGSQFGFAVHFTDDDGDNATTTDEPSVRLAWSREPFDVDNAWQNPAAFNIIELAGPSTDVNDWSLY